MSPLAHPVVIAPPDADDGGGFLATVPDLPGCMAGGETPEAASPPPRRAVG